jgi:hypothetical protein
MVRESKKSKAEKRKRHVMTKVDSRTMKMHIKMCIILKHAIFEAPRAVRVSSTVYGLSSVLLNENVWLTARILGAKDSRVRVS